MFKYLSLSALALSAALTAENTHAADAKIDWHIYADTYYAYNFNKPAATTTPTGSSVASASIPDGKNTFRGYDLNNNTISLSLLELSVAATKGDVSFLADLDFGTFADVNATIGSGTTKSVDEVSKHIGQAVVTYRPEGSRFSMDVGKMYTHIGWETAKAKDNFNYSRSFNFVWGMPIWHTGVRLGYEVLPSQFYVNGYVYNGWNSIYDNNQSKTLGAQLKYVANDNFNASYNYIRGSEKANSEDERKSMHELNANLTVGKLFLGADLLMGQEQNVTVGTNLVTGKWYGALLAVKYVMNDRCYISPRVEYFRDKPGMLLSNGSLALKSAVLTYGHVLTPGLELRGEGRWDHASKKAFTKGLMAKNSQSTFTVAMLFNY